MSGRNRFVGWRVRTLLVGWTLCLSSTAGAVSDDYQQKVKTTADYHLFSDDGYLWTFGWSCGVVGFNPASGVQIAPGSGDPNTQTSNPISSDSCWLYIEGGQGGMEIRFTFNSLRDVGDWTITCDGTHVDPAWCVSDGVTPPCGIACDLGAVTPWLEPYTFFVEVWNDPPTASPSHSPTPAWNQTVTLHANASDPDGGSLSYSWSVVNSPPGASASLSGTTGANPTIAFSNDDNIGDWEFRVHVDDNEGERRTFYESFEVPNVETAISIAGPSDVDASDTIELLVSPTDDIDGGALDITWEIVAAPPGAPLGASTSFDDGVPPIERLVLPTTGEYVGTWEFRARAVDNEGAETTDSIVVEVHNKPPRIEFSGTDYLPVGGTIQLETLVVDDDDGGVLTFEWEVIQVPEPAAGMLGYLTDQAAIPPIVTGPSDAGTWRFRLTATDDEGESVTEEFTPVLVDAPPVAAINDGGFEVLGPATSPFVFDSASTDPDTDVVHVTTPDTTVQGVSPGVTHWVWYLTEVPYDSWPEYFPGRVDEVLGIPGTSATLYLDYTDLEVGWWWFQLEVTDGEGNPSTNLAEDSLLVIPPNWPPFANVSPDRRYLVDAGGLLGEDIVLSGAASFDLDNYYDGPVGPGIGIDTYQWDLLPPVGCSPPPAPATATFTLYAAGAIVPPECQGVWTIRLTVEDDDAPPLTSSADTHVIIGNCPLPICIDYPTTMLKHIEEVAEDTDVPIFYHVDSALYDSPFLAYGMFAELHLYHESDPVTPVFTSPDPNVLPTDKGGFGVFQWNGLSSFYSLPIAGSYHVEVEVLDYAMAPTGMVAVEFDAIRISVAQIELTPPPVRYFSADQLESGAVNVEIPVTITGATTATEVVWRVMDSGASVVHDVPVPAPFAGPIVWDGRIGGVVVPDDYTVEVEVFRDGASMGVSDPVDLTIYRLALEIGGATAPDSLPGTFVYVNGDDDNRNNVSDATESVPAEDDLVEVALQVEPVTLQGELTLANAGGGAPLFRLWDGPAKGAETVLGSWTTPSMPPATLHIEGTLPGEDELRLTFATTDGVDLEPAVASLTLVSAEVVLDSDDDHAITAADLTTFFVGVARWDNAYGPAPGFAVANAADPANFIEQDPSRFYLRVTDPSANADPATAETLTVQPRLGTIDAAAAVEDDLTALRLVETGPDTGVFLSRSQLLTSLDIQVVDDASADDEFHASDGGAATVADDALGDRTHRVQIDGAVRLSYTPTGAPAAHLWNVPVCQRAPEARRFADIRVHVYDEPFDDVGFDDDGDPATPVVGAGNGTFDFTDTNGNGQHDLGEASEEYVDLSGGSGVQRSGSDPLQTGARGPVVTDAQVAAEFTRASISWAQGCIRVQQAGAIAHVAAPRVAGVDILLDANVSSPGDVAAIYAQHSAGMTANTLDVIFAGPIVGAAALALPPANPVIAHGEHSFVIMVPNMPINFRTMGHELGHIFANAPDVATPQPIFFPSTAPQSAVINDSAINMQRRLTLATVNAARTVRAVGAGHTMDAGNSILQTPP